MWVALKELLASRDMWSALLYLITGIVGGAILGVVYSLRAHRPRLIISGGGSGGSQGKSRWNISISNRPSFFGQPLDGESARDVNAHIRLVKHRSRSYPVYWGEPGAHSRTIEPGQTAGLTLFAWEEGSAGYFIVDASGAIIARFQDPEIKFILRLNDRLGRSTEFPFTVEFDESHLRQTPELRIVHPLTGQMRLQRARDGMRRFLSAFRTR